MNCIELRSISDAGGLLGSRDKARSVRKNLELRLEKEDSIKIDFLKTNATQSFIDELIGILIWIHGPEILKKIVFKNCSDDTKTIIKFVVSDRLAEYQQKAQVA